MDIREFNAGVIDEFRTNAGKLSGVLAGKPILLLTTTGARTGERRTTPLGYVEDSGRLVVFASNRAAASHPDWYHNLRTHPEVGVELGTRSFPARAVTATGTERQRLRDLFTAAHPGTEKHQGATGREIPVVILLPL